MKAAKLEVEVFGVNNLMRLGERSDRDLAQDGIRVFYGDIREGEAPPDRGFPFGLAQLLSALQFIFFSSIGPLIWRFPNP